MPAASPAATAGDVIAAWRAAAEAAKFPQESVRYRPGTTARTCATCGYHDGGGCLIVAGTSGDTGTCDLWKQAAAQLEQTDDTTA